MENTNYAINMEHVCKSYRDFTLNDVTLRLPTGTVMGYVGQNGSGKTTSIKALLNLFRPDSGSIQLLNRDMKTDAESVKQDIGVVFDELALPDTLTCKMVNSIMKNIYKNWDENTFFHYMEVFELPDNKIFRKFSRGMQMKTQLAIALSHDAKLLILDEATAGLDPIARNELLDILLEYMEKEEHSILMSSHITSDLERVADYVTFIDKGTILLSDEKYSILENHSIVKGSIEEIKQLPNEYVINSRKNSYGAEALVNNPEAIRQAYPKLVQDKATLDDILCFYAARHRNKTM